MKPAVLCISREELVKQGIPSDALGVYHFDLESVPDDSFHFINRKVVDSTVAGSFDEQVGQNFPQILGYVVLKHEDKYLSYARKYSGELRLLGNRSIGFGGHADIEDSRVKEDGSINPAAVIEDSVERELREELDYNRWVSIPRKAELIVDTSNPVGKVHVGLLVMLDANPHDLTSTKETQDLQWLTLEELQADRDLYEGWSKIVIDQLVTEKLGSVA